MAQVTFNRSTGVSEGPVDHTTIFDTDNFFENTRGFILANPTEVQVNGVLTYPTGWVPVDDFETFNSEISISGQAVTFRLNPGAWVRMSVATTATTPTATFGSGNITVEAGAHTAAPLHTGNSNQILLSRYL